MSGLAETVSDMKPHKRIPVGAVAIGVCFILFGISGLAGSSLTVLSLMTGLISLAVALVSRNLLWPLDQRFELGTRSAEHQYGPFKIKVESTIGYESEEDYDWEYKFRTVDCEAIAEDGDTLAAESERRIVGSAAEPGLTSLFHRGGDDAHAQTTESHVREVSARVKDDALDRIANGDNDPGLKAALETELGEEWYGKKNDESAKEVSVADA
jgi:hypothetical protein